MNKDASDSQMPQMKLAWFLLRLFVVAVLINYVWEIVQAPLYVGMENFNLVWWHCGLAALGDGLLVLLIYAVGWGVLRRRDWFVRPGIAGYAVILAAGCQRRPIVGLRNAAPAGNSVSPQQRAVLRKMGSLAEIGNCDASPPSCASFSAEGGNRQQLFQCIFFLGSDCQDVPAATGWTSGQLRAG